MNDSQFKPEKWESTVFACISNTNGGTNGGKNRLKDVIREVVSEGISA